jgi:macrolide-specific efflux system membrane fusion protein
MTAQVTIVIEQKQGVLTLPASALGTVGRDGLYRVGVYDEASRQTRIREVTVGLNNNITAEITDGLSEGDRVVAGPSALSSGAGNGGARGGLGGLAGRGPGVFVRGG